MELREQIAEAFRQAEWEEIPIPAGSPLHGLFGSGYAAVAFLASEDSNELLRLWPECQNELLELKPQLGREKDLYLVLVTPRADDDQLNRFAEALSDTHVARKILVEVRDRSLEKALEDLAVFTSRRDKAADPVVAAPGRHAVPPGIPDSVLTDLGQRSSGVILGKLLAHEYESSE